jgi:tetratricopeptide (TPR) repeat protein
MYLLKKDSADGRALMWKISLQAVVKHPFGVGLGNFSGIYGKEQAAYFATGKATETEEYIAGNPEYAFNEYLQIAIESGLASLFLFILILVTAFCHLMRTNNRGIAGSLFSLSVFCLFSYPFSVLPYLIVFVFLISCGRNEDDSNNTVKCKFPEKFIYINRLYSGFVALICLVISSFCFYKQYPVYGAYKQWNSDKLLYSAELYKDAANNYEKLYPFLNDRTQFLFEYAQSLSKTGEYAKSNEVLERAVQISCDPMLYNIMGKNYQALKNYEQAESYFLKASYIVPNRLYPHYLSAKMYDETGQHEKARNAAKVVLTKEPKVQSPAVREMREEMEKICR